MLILNSGGTFNKRYNAKKGELEVPYDNQAIDSILASTNFDFNIAGVVYKDSLEIDINDRKMLANIILESKEDTFVVVHGTDTIDETAEFFDAFFDDRKIVLVGAMKPFEIDKVESSFNLGMAIGFAKTKNDCGVYICMNGMVENWDKLKKNKQLGKFEIVR